MNAIHISEAKALVSLAKYQSKLAVRYGREGLLTESRKYRTDSWWHFEKAHQKRALAVRP